MVDRMILSEKDASVRFEVHAKPRAKKSRILGVRGGALEIALAAPPVDGAANEELVRTLVEALSVPRRRVVLVRGESSRTKVLQIEGMTADTLRDILANVLSRD